MKNRLVLNFVQATQVFAIGEDTLALRLTSKLVDLRAGYVNRILLRRRRAERSSNRMTPPKKRKTASHEGYRATQVFATGEDTLALQGSGKGTGLYAYKSSRRDDV